ncbi:MAG TPA: PIN domain-containing protein [Flavobacteriales bacterium]|nr:PIN domain-containing protein [Flavobacteriales bacterium]
MQYLLDTSTCIFFLRGRLDLDSAFRQKKASNCFISEITVFELYYGAANSDDPAKSYATVGKFIAGLTIIPIFTCARQYAETKVHLKRNGTPMHDEFDLIIGVTAATNDLTLVTDNGKDFRFIKNLKVENWMAKQ